MDKNSLLKISLQFKIMELGKKLNQRIRKTTTMGNSVTIVMLNKQTWTLLRSGAAYMLFRAAAALYSCPSEHA